MRKSRFTEYQIVRILNSVEGPTRTYAVKTASECHLLQMEIEIRGHGGVLHPTDEGSRSRKSQTQEMYADLSLENTALKDIIEKKL
ncbi:transposase [Pseudodesulfovibrio sediminis]|uniref:Transposase n=1 Tax=Pseudodesulfovibrio sediminis TaxID=2810563 RepID=A0ABM9SDQ7_9BACT|nr:transposase [Pseudodesulfovibrio sediminis]